MDGLGWSWQLAGPIALVVVAAFVIGAARLARSLPIRTSAFHCPWARRPVVVRHRLGEGWHDSRLVGCSAIDQGEATGCAARCVQEGGPADLAERAGGDTPEGAGDPGLQGGSR